jgi:signal transduction histidine kinase
MLGTGKGGDLNEKQIDYLSKASRGVERMLNMINETLNISKIDQGKVQLKIEEIDIDSFIDEIIPDFKIKAGEKNLELRVLVDEKCRIVFGDRVKLREIVTNLLGNSLKFTPSGWIEIKLSNNNGSFIKFEISDTGKGIDHNDLDRLFKKFGRIDNSYQTVAEAGGTGLGLYIVKNMVESMGGQVGAESEGVGKGSKFWFTLPGEYYEVPESLRESAIFTLAPLAETEITSICPV